MANRNGWATSAKPTGSSRNTMNLLEQERFLTSLEVDDIPIIPDIDDLAPDHNPEEIRPAKYSSTIKSSIKELDSELIKQTSSVEGIDLSTLAKCLLSDEELKEDDVPWTWNTIFADNNIKEAETKDAEEIERL